jgi:CRISPR-associated protein Csx17
VTSSGCLYGPAPATFREVRHLYAEGRAKVPTRRGGKADQREAVDGLDFARAIASLGVNRGNRIVRARFGFQQRNGLSFFAVPPRSVDSCVARRVPTCSPNSTRGSPGFAVTSTRARLRRRWPARHTDSRGAIMEVCQREDWTTMLEVLIALGELESTISRAKERPLEPLPSLSPQWYSLTKGDPTPEYRLAASLASAGLRPRLIPVERKGKRHWSWLPASSKTATWMATASLETNLIELLRRREIEDQQGGEASTPSRRLGDRDRRRARKGRTTSRVGQPGRHRRIHRRPSRERHR